MFCSDPISVDPICPLLSLAAAEAARVHGQGAVVDHEEEVHARGVVPQADPLPRAGAVPLVWAILGDVLVAPADPAPGVLIVAIFYPFSQFCEIGVSLLSLQTQPKTAPNLFQRGVEYGKYGPCGTRWPWRADLMGAQTAGHKSRGRKQNSFIYDAFHHVLLEIWIKLVTSFWRWCNSAAMVPQSAPPPGLHPLVRARMRTGHALELVLEAAVAQHAMHVLALLYNTIVNCVLYYNILHYSIV